MQFWRVSSISWGMRELMNKSETNSAGPPFSTLLGLADVQGMAATELG